ncbi:MAG: hypothetical protein E7170_01360 [Firmicutes bacterium]|nr:hypothetical protein [Bacillota bacterium]
MDFISQNYLWIIIIVIFILMAIVGYIAEKTGFISQAESPIKKQKKANVKEQPVVIENKGIDELLKEANERAKILEEANLEEEAKKSKGKKLKGKKSKDEPVEIKEEETAIPEDFLNPTLIAEEVPVINESTEDISQPLVNNEIVENNEVVDEALFAPLESTDVSYVEPTVEDNVQELNTEVTNETVSNPDEDIWKF